MGLSGDSPRKGVKFVCFCWQIAIIVFGRRSVARTAATRGAGGVVRVVGPVRWSHGVPEEGARSKLKPTPPLSTPQGRGRRGWKPLQLPHLFTSSPISHRSLCLLVVRRAGRSRLGGGDRTWHFQRFACAKRAECTPQGPHSAAHGAAGVCVHRAAMRAFSALSHNSNTPNSTTQTLPNLANRDTHAIRRLEDPLSQCRPCPAKRVFMLSVVLKKIPNFFVTISVPIRI